MSDRIKGLVVVTDDLHEDDAAELITIISRLRGVVSIERSVVDYEDVMNRVMIKRELSGKLWEVLK